jgi:hypothetical protein
VLAGAGRLACLAPGTMNMSVYSLLAQNGTRLAAVPWLLSHRLCWRYHCRCHGSGPVRIAFRERPLRWQPVMLQERCSAKILICAVFNAPMRLVAVILNEVSLLRGPPLTIATRRAPRSMAHKH